MQSLFIVYTRLCITSYSRGCSPCLLVPQSNPPLIYNFILKMLSLVCSPYFVTI
ncbi:hypothetical protein BDA99DRAFT_500242 [Phascolomyces articulosus]|uniref:Uncharacterized protein n=1 Tax=Phascolomyces articulosus TaxID=60185 RepID=A0AAD5PGL6_9FUNG|nr:hypothetical protein BDA99DRAFT_500242 [Phascolomyces articulosus]